MSNKKPEEFESIQDFIDFYEAIPEEKWTTGNYEKDGRCCAYGHLGFRGKIWNQEDPILQKLFFVLQGLNINNLIDINDGIDVKSLGPTPKQRILNYFKELQCQSK